MRILPQNMLAKRIIIAASVAAVLLFGYYIYTLLQFRISGIDPSPKNITTETKEITIHFNRNINTASFKLKDSDIISSTEVQPKSVKLVFSRELERDTKYSLVIETVRDVNGDTLTNKSINFTPKYIQFDKLPESEQKRLISEQDERLYELNKGIVTTGFETLTNYGMTSGQVTNIQRYLYDYSNVIDKKFWNMNIVENSVSVRSHQPEDEDQTDFATFTVNLENIPYTVEVSYEVPYSGIGFVLKNSAGSVVYDPAAEHTDD